MEAFLTAVIACAVAAGTPAPEAGAQGHYLVLTGKTDAPPPFAFLDITYGPRQDSPEGQLIWWQMEAGAKPEKGDERIPLFRLRVLSRVDPLAADRAPDRPLGIARYILRIDSARENLEYRNVHTGKALLPGWKDFEMGYLPRRSRGGSRMGFPETAELLGHVLTLVDTKSGLEWGDGEGAKVLDLDPELQIGTGRNFRDQEGHRLPQVPERKNYTYVPFTEAEYPVMIEAGINVFTVDDKQVEWVRAKPVFLIWGGGGKKGYPEDLYRSNWLGPVMFLDEPAIFLVGDKNINTTLLHFSDVAALLRKRIHEEADTFRGYGKHNIERSLRDGGANLGDLDVAQVNFPVWETIFETAHDQLEAGLPGIVHEGRYQLAPFDKAVASLSGTERKHTPEELLRYHYAVLRGAARAFDASWGTSIYGQCDPAISPLAVTLAYDMGARYIWFWTSDHDHHMPWPEQLELAKAVRKRAQERPRASIAATKPVLDKAIAIPYPYFPSLENLWWIRSMDAEGKNEASKSYRRLMKRVIEEVHRAFDAKEDFDIVIDSGKPIDGYKQVVKVTGG
jgi:hypothetical protein